MHFEELWEKCEDFYKKSQASDPDSMETILDELMLKLNVYKMLISKSEMPEDELQKAKSRTFGEILLTMTNFSLKENVNVFDSLSSALKYRLVSHFDKKHSV